MDLTKISDFFDPTKVQGKVHIIGCGAVGSTLAENLARAGIDNFVLYDFDRVESKNVVNQMFAAADIGQFKVNAVERIIKSINPDASVRKRPSGWNGEVVSGYVFMCPDSIEIRQRIARTIKDSPFVKGVFDFRTALTSAQHFAADWSDKDQRDAFISSMDFSGDEVQEVTTACGETLGVAPTVRVIVAYGVANFMNFIKGDPLKKVIVADAFSFNTVAF